MEIGVTRVKITQKCVDPSLRGELGTFMGQKGDDWLVRIDNENFNTILSPSEVELVTQAA